MALGKWMMAACMAAALATGAQAAPPATSGNPILKGWYADPEAAVFANRYWIFPTTSADYDAQITFDAFSSPDLVHWTKHADVLNARNVPWAKRAMWAPSVVENKGKYYFFFAANDIKTDSGPCSASRWSAPSIMARSPSTSSCSRMTMAPGT